MIIRSLQCRNFRNYRNLFITFDPGINFLYGDNAQGKTNILEAICLCCFLKSPRGAKEREMILFGEEEAHIRMEIDKISGSHRIDFHINKKSKKSMALNGFPVKQATEIFGFMNIVIFSADDLNIIKNGPSARRKFLNREISGTNLLYMKNLYSYQKVIQNRNRLLKEIETHPSLLETLDAWDQQLVKYGTAIIRERKKYLGDLEKVIVPMHRQLTGQEETLSVLYEPNTEEEDLEEKVKSTRQKDICMRQTTTGPHRDDFKILSNGVDLRIFGSQGQQRSAALSLKLSEIHQIREKRNEYPVLLLDDVFSELDVHRQEYLLSEIKKTQTIMTGTGLDQVIRENIRIDKMFLVKNGKVLVYTS